MLKRLYSPLVETATPLAGELFAMRSIFLSRLVYQTYNGCVMSQFKKMQADLRNQGQAARIAARRRGAERFAGANSIEGNEQCLH